MSAGIRRRIALVGVWSLVVTGLVSGNAVSASGGEERLDGPPLVVTFTKWITADGFPWMAGIVGGAVGEGTFAGEVVAYRDYGANCSNPSRGCLTFPFTLIEAVYNIQAGDRSFTALIRGGASDRTGRGTLNGAILDGWMTGATVHVEFQSLFTCSGNPAGPCFEGTITIRPTRRE
jgi:hypothetical protein